MRIRDLNSTVLQQVALPAPQAVQGTLTMQCNDISSLVRQLEEERERFAKAEAQRAADAADYACKVADAKAEVDQANNVHQVSKDKIPLPCKQCSSCDARHQCYVGQVCELYCD